MSARRRRSGVYPDLQTGDIFFGGGIRFWRNPAGQPFADTDKWSFVEDFDRTDEMSDAYARLEAQENALAQQHAFAWCTDFGYLSPNPFHCGTALHVGAAFHLEALHLIGDLPTVLAGIEAVRFSYSSVTLDGIRQAAHVFRVGNAATLGIAERDLVARARRLFEDIVVQELNARKAIVEESPRVLEDSVARTLAILRHARLLAPGELLDLLSPIRLALSMGFLDGITLAETDKLIKKELNANELPPAANAEDTRLRDARDARLADWANRHFANVRLSPLAEEYLA